MLINAETLQMRISRLKRMVAETSAIPEETPEEIKYILKNAPRMLQDTFARMITAYLGGSMKF